MTKLKTLQEKANIIRKDVITVATKNGAGHIAPSLSCIDILTSLYYEIMNIPKPNSAQWASRDRLIFSKAHGCYGLYSILADLGIIPESEWQNFYAGSPLTGCIERDESRGIEGSCGSLGHGLPMAVGIAFGAKIQGKTYRSYCIVGDGEMQEGTMWEAIQFASKHKLSNLTLIIDHNSLQAMDFTHNVLSAEESEAELILKMKAFGFETVSCNGHNPEEISSILNSWKSGSTDKPQTLIANTVKGYGLKCMENVPKFHFRLPTPEELNMGKRYE